MWSPDAGMRMIRTPKLPFIQSRASAPVTLLTCTGIAGADRHPVYAALAQCWVWPPCLLTYFAYLIPCILLYMVLATA